MSKSVKDNNEQTGIENVESALTRAEMFFEHNQKVITIIFAVIIVLVGGYFSFKKFYLAPKEIEAQEQMFMAEQFFEKDSFNLALNGDGMYFGFKKIVNDYGITKSANLAKYYAGICYLRLGNYAEAIESLKGFSSDDKMVSSIALGATGDAYMETGKKDEAIEYYEKAARNNENDFTSPIYLMKAGEAYEAKGENKKALAIYQEIKEKYPKSFEGRQVDKYIERAEILTEK